ncbi:MAG: hypothetical protein HC906_00315 [Bacteroidales bacterium]|nr:hypothetical protein [Bacteroidales bacterium]
MLSPSISDTVDFFQPKSTEPEVLNQIIEDLKVASSFAYTDQYKSIPEYWKGRANKYSIMALMADIYLWQGKYQECVTYCDSIINTGQFSLEPSNNWFSLYYPGNSMVESLFEIQYSSSYTSQENPIYDDVIRLNVSNMNPTENLLTLFETSDIRKANSGNQVTPFRKYNCKSVTGLTRSATEKDANFIYYRFADILFFKSRST